MIVPGKQRRLENAIYAILWLIIFCVPFLDYLMTEDATFVWRDCYRTWLALAPFLILFLFHNFLAIPRFFNPKKYWRYAIFTVFSIALIFAIYPRFLTDKRMRHDNHPPMMQREMMPSFSGGPGRMPEPQKEGEKDRFHEAGRMHDPGKAGEPGKMGEFDMMGKKPKPLFDPRTGESIFANILISFLLVGFNIAVNLFFKSMNDQQTLRELEKHNLQFELDYLKGQINPHFLMNMLNNIHALVDIDAEKAKETIIGFSKLMRYVLYDGSQKTIGLEKEVEFIRNYVELMAIRYPQDVDIKLSLPKIVPDIQIPPMLFVSFIENSFKHGISYRNRSFVDISLSLDESNIYYTVRNSVWVSQDEAVPSGGIGLANTKKRLDLIYGNSYKLITEKSEKEYLVNLIIPLVC